MRVDGMSSGADGLESVQACHCVLLTCGFLVPLLVHADSAPHLEMAFLTRIHSLDKCKKLSFEQERLFRKMNLNNNIYST